MAVEFTLTEARRRLSELLDRAESGEEVVVVRRGHPPMTLVQHGRARGPLPDITQAVRSIEVQGETVLEVFLKERAESRY
ncbi:MAG: type II toxin-antitoxin system prevent-host-death family antitoxin [Nitrococcus sp.]|nr:type II toxin-antitoxin system prevent-host-death family antitoxin [Nitrococcus sp.]